MKENKVINTWQYYLGDHHEQAPIFFSNVLQFS